MTLNSQQSLHLHSFCIKIPYGYIPPIRIPLLSLVKKCILGDLHYSRFRCWAMKCETFNACKTSQARKRAEKRAKNIFSIVVWWLYLHYEYLMSTNVWICSNCTCSTSDHPKLGRINRNKLKMSPDKKRTRMFLRNFPFKDKVFFRCHCFDVDIFMTVFESLV